MRVRMGWWGNALSGFVEAETRWHVMDELGRLDKAISSDVDMDGFPYSQSMLDMNRYFIETYRI